jgi:hypothetical protein
LQKYHTIARLFIGVLLLNHAQQEYGSNAISNQSLDRVSVGTWWIFDWGRKNAARPSFEFRRMGKEAGWAGFEFRKYFLSISNLL